jgi:hypothetical protein
MNYTSIWTASKNKGNELISSERTKGSTLKVYGLEVMLFIRNRIVICTLLTLYEGGKLTIPFYFYFPVLVSIRPLSALL